MSWEIASLALLAAAIGAGFAWYERSRPPARLLAVVAALAALAVIGRIAFAAFPNVKPTTDIVLLAGYGLGGAPGFAVGAVTALASNFFLLQGPWTPWQMTAWGGVGIAGALLAKILRGRDPSRWLLAAACGVAGLAFGALMDVYQWTLAAEQSFASYLAIAATSLPYNLAHAIGNIVFALLIGKPLVNAVRRVRARLEVRWEGAPATVATLLLVAALVVPAAAVSKKDDGGTARTGDPATDALTFLRTAQNEDGGFGDDRGDKSDQLFSGWAALAFAAAGYNPASTTNGGDTLIDYIEDGVKKLDDAPSLARTILVVDASGLDAEKFGGENLVRSLERERDSSGAYDNQVAVTAFALLAQKAAGVNGGAKRSAAWILEQQNEDGGWAIRSGSRSDVDVTASVLQALDATGELGKRPKTDALEWLAKAQNGDGGFGQFDGASSNSQSTAFAIQGLEAAGEDPADFGRGDPIEYLEDQQLKDGSVKYGGGSNRTPVWVTSQAILGFERAALPLSELSDPGSFGSGKTPDQNDLVDEGDDPPKTPDPPSSPSPGPNITPPDPGDFPKPDKPKRPDPGPKPGTASPGQADLVPPAFSFSSIVAEPEPPSSLTQAGVAAGAAAALAAAPGEAPGIEPGQAVDAAAAADAASVLDEAAAAARSAAAAAGSAGA